MSALWCCAGSTTRVADRQPIYAVIVGSATNQDGKSNGITAPNRWAQSQVMQRALDRAGAAARDITFVEAHGTGTMLGDMIEANALGDLHRAGRDRPCLLGSIKGNIGHPKAQRASPSLIKSGLAVVPGVLPPTVAPQPDPTRRCGWTSRVCSWPPRRFSSGRNGSRRSQFLRSRRQQRPRPPGRPSRSGDPAAGGDDEVGCHHGVGPFASGVAAQRGRARECPRRRAPTSDVAALCYTSNRVKARSNIASRLAGTRNDLTGPA